MKILHRFTGAVLWEDDSPTMRETLEAAVRARGIECAPGIHFFATRAEAEAYL